LGPIWISHRGLKQRNIENSRGAFDAAVAAGFSWIETDLRLTVDGHVVLTHDEDLVRLCGERVVVAKSTRDVLERIVLPGGEKLMFLEEFIDRYAALNWVFDIKESTGHGVALWLCEWARKNRAVEFIAAQTKFLCWDPAHELVIAQTFGTVPFYAKKSECWRAGLAMLAGLPSLGGIKAGRTYSVISELGGRPLFSPDIVSMLRKRGARSLAFLPGSSELAKAAVAAGFDEILSDEPWFVDQN
jgi:glycerophosphoryl diester phosphodiesterase